MAQNLAYNTPANIYLLNSPNNPVPGPANTIMEGCCCGGLGVCQACSGCITLIIEIPSINRFLLVGLDAAGDCHTTFSIIDADMYSSHTLAGDTKVTAWVVFTADDVYVNIVVEYDTGSGVEFWRHTVQTQHAPGDTTEPIVTYGCDVWTNQPILFDGIELFKITDEGDPVEDCDETWGAAGTANVKIYVNSPPITDSTSQGTSNQYRIMASDIASFACNLPTSGVSWDGIMTLSTGKWAYTGPHYQDTITAELEMDIVENKYRLRIWCPGDLPDEPKFDAFKSEKCGGPDGTYGSMTVEVYP